MVKRFTDIWKNKEQDQSLVSKIKNVTKPADNNIKEQITQVTQRLEVQTKMLDNAVVRFQNRDKEIFNRIIKAMSQRETERANILATELSEIRKVEKMLSHASLALQSVSMRLNTVSELGDVVSVLSPAKNLLANIRTDMCSIMPEASQELGNIGDLLTDIVTSTNQSNDMPVNTIMASADALQILEEAETAVESRLREQLPDAATENSMHKRTSLEA